VDSLKRFWKWASNQDMNASLAKTSAFKRKIQVGDRVIHNVTGCRGTVIAADVIAGKETISVACIDRKTIRNLARHEFNLANAENFTTEHADVQEAASQFLQDLRMDASAGISQGSILDQIEK
jgi:hypothetical protein